MVDQTGRRQALLDVLREPLASAGFDLEDVEVAQAGRRSVVRVLVDTDSGVTLDAIADATRLVNDRLDGDDVLGAQPYTLEVTSPGVDRPLTEPRHWRRNVGRLVKVSHRSGDSTTGRITTVDDVGVRLETEGTRHHDGGERAVAYDDITVARIQIEFQRRRQDHEQDEQDEQSGPQQDNRQGRE